MKSLLTLLLLQSPPVTNGIKTLHQSDEASFKRPAHLDGYNPNRFIIKGDADDVERFAEREGGTVRGRIDHGQYTVIEFESHDVAESFRFSISSVDGVSDVEQDTPVFSHGTIAHDIGERSSLRALQENTPWGIDKVFEDENGNPNVPSPNYFPEIRHEICIIDSGYEVSHPDLPSGARAADNQQSNSNNADDYFGKDTCGHGSHVAGTVLASDNNRGVLGVFPGAASLIVKVFHGFSCAWTYRSGLTKAVEECVDKGAKIISMSLGGPYSSNSEKSMFERLYEDEGVLIIAAAGNDGDSSMSYPASYEKVMSVGATDVRDRIASFSQYNTQVDISAPGVDVRSTVGNGYKSYSGTSMATPHVAGVALLLWNKFPNCSNKKIRQALEAGVDDLGSPGRDNYFGHGLLKYWKAAKYLETNSCGGGGGNPPSPTPPSPTPPSPTPPSPTRPSPTQPTPPGSKKKFELALSTDNHGEETTWWLKDSNGRKVISGGPYGDNAHYLEEAMLSTGSYTFKMMDAYSDGICCDYGRGSFEIRLDGENLYTGASFHDEDIFEFDVTTRSGPSPAPPSPSPPTPNNPPDCEQFKFEIKTDNWGDETSWFLQERNDGPIKSGGNYASNTQYTDTACLPSGEYKFTIKDTQGDGICCSYGNGSYELFLSGVSIHKGGEYRRREKTYFNVAASSTAGRFGTMSFEGVEQPNQAVKEMDCSQFELEIKTDHRSDGISWQLEDHRHKDILSGESFRDNKIYYFEECIPFGNYTFIMHDRYGDGFYGYYGYGYYKLILNDKEIHTGKQFGFKDIVSFDSRTGEIDHHTTGIDH